MILQESTLRALMDCPLDFSECVDSTNNRLKRLAAAGAPDGTVAIARRQSAGRGRMGRRFDSETGGLYLSLLLRPRAEDSLLCLTAAAAAAVRRAIFEVCGLQTDIKWRNDLLLGGKKLCGILTELSFSGALPEYAVLGVGINCNQPVFSEPLREIAVSLRQVLGAPVEENALAAAVIRHLTHMAKALPNGCKPWMEEYAAACITVGQRVRILGGDGRIALAEGVDENGGLCLRYENGETAVLGTGEVSVRSVETEETL